MKKNLLKDWKLYVYHNGKYAITGRVYNSTHDLDDGYKITAFIKQIDFIAGIAITKGSKFNLGGEIKC